MVQRTERGDTAASEGPRDAYYSRAERIKRHLSHHPNYYLARFDPRIRQINAEGSEDATFYVAPKKPEYSLDILDRVQRKLVGELEISGKNHPSVEDRSGMRFGLFVTQEPLFHYTQRKSVTEDERGAATKIGIIRDAEKEMGMAEITRDSSSSANRTIFVVMYPHPVLADIAHFNGGNVDDRFAPSMDHYLDGLDRRISNDQLAVFKRLVRRNASFRETRDALIAVGLVRDINAIAERNQMHVDIGPEISLRFK